MNMVLKNCIIVCCILFVCKVIFTLAKIRFEYKYFNGGVCPKCGEPLVKVDIDLQGDRGYYCYKCKHAALVSFRWIDKNYKK